MTHGRFVTAINCMDGRTQLPVSDWLRQRYGADYVDTITEPGPVRLLADGVAVPTLDSIRQRVAISVEKHGSRHVAIVAHHDCAGNPESEAVQRRQLTAAQRTIESWGLGVGVDLLWLGEDWRVELVES
jgi:hypothetical protein